MTKRWATLAWLVAVTLLCAGDAAAERVWYIYLHGSALQFGFSRAGPYYSLSECQSMARKMGLAVDCTREEDAGPTPEDLALMQQQAVDAQRRQEQYLAEQRRLEAERERLRQVSYYNSQGNDMLNGGRYDEAIRAYEIALGYGQDPVVAGNLSLARYKRAFGDGHKYFADQQWDLAIGAYSLALTYRPDDRAAEANIQAAGAWKHYEQEKAQRRAMLEAAFGNMQSAINAHAEVAEVDRAAFLNEREAKGRPKPKLRFGDPDSPTDQALRAKIEVLDAKIDRDIQAIKNLGLGRFNEDYEDWVQLEEEARAAAEKQFLDILTEFAYDALKDATFNGLKSLDRARGVALIYRIENCKCALNNPILIERIKLMTRRGNAARLAEDAKIVTWEFEKLMKGTPKSRLKFAADVLELFVKDPRLKMVLKMDKMAVAATYRVSVKTVARGEVERLTSMTVDQLKALPNVQKVLIKHVKQRRELKLLLPSS